MTALAKFANISVQATTTELDPHKNATVLRDIQCGADMGQHI